MNLSDNKKIEDYIDKVRVKVLKKLNKELVK